MFTRYHIAKAQRLEATLKKLDPEDDYEMIIDLCMLAGTHYYNAALHAADITPQMHDQGHSAAPPLEYLRKSITPEIKSGVELLAYIEGIRPTYVRGNTPCDGAQLERVLNAFETIKKTFSVVIGNAGETAVWEPKEYTD